MKHVTTGEGILVNSETIKPNNVVEVTYSGLLAQSGAQDVFIHCGSSEGKSWKDIQDIKMDKKDKDTFTANVLVQDGQVFNVCFRDNANNWDNNSGNNYSFRIQSQSV